MTQVKCISAMQVVGCIERLLWSICVEISRDVTMSGVRARMIHLQKGMHKDLEVVTALKMK